MKAKARKLLALLLCILMLAGTMVTTVSAASGVSGSSRSSSMDDVSDILNAMSYTEYMKKYADKEKGGSVITIDAKDYVSAPDTVEVLDNYYGESDVLYIPEVGTVTWEVDVPAEALYTIVIEYCQYAGKTNSIERVFYLNGTVPFSGARSVILSKIRKPGSIPAAT